MTHCVCECLCTRARVCVCVCVCERDRERESVDEGGGSVLFYSKCTEPFTKLCLVGAWGGGGGGGRM